MTFSKNRIGVPFGNSNAQVDLPVSAQPDGSESRETGYTSAHETKVSLGGKPLQRSILNQILKETQGAIKDIQNTGAPPWFSQADNNGFLMNYPIGARVWHSSAEWISNINNNNTEPGTVGASWGLPAIGINNNIGIDIESTIGLITYTSADFGKIKYINSTSATSDSRDLPEMTGNNAALVGASIRIIRTGTADGDLTIDGNGANIQVGAGDVASLTLKPGDDALFVWLGAYWAMLGSAAKRFTNPIFISGSTTVSQTHTGMIIQSFRSDFSSNGSTGVVFNLPVAFRTTNYHVLGCDIGNLCNILASAPMTTTTFRGWARAGAGTYPSTSGAIWHAIGY